MRVIRLMALMGPLLFVVAACTSTAYRPETVHTADHGYRTIAVGPITAKDDELWHSYAVLTRRALIAQLIESQAFGQVLDTVPDPLPAGMVMVDGEITEFDKGNVAMRWLIGFGAGSAHVVGSFRVSEPAGGIALKFTASKSYAGGMGIRRHGYGRFRYACPPTGRGASGCDRLLGENRTDAVGRFWFRPGQLYRDLDELKNQWGWGGFSCRAESDNRS